MYSIDDFKEPPLKNWNKKIIYRDNDKYLVLENESGFDVIIIEEKDKGFIMKNSFSRNNSIDKRFFIPERMYDFLIEYVNNKD